MPNAHAADKENISMFIARPLATRLRKKARARGETLTDYCISLFTRETKDIELSPEDYQAIAEATRRAQLARKPRATKYTRGPGAKSATKKTRRDGK